MVITIMKGKKEKNLIYGFSKFIFFHKNIMKKFRFSNIPEQKAKIGKFERHYIIESENSIRINTNGYECMKNLFQDTNYYEIEPIELYKRILDNTDLMEKEFIKRDVIMEVYQFNIIKGVNK